MQSSWVARRRAAAPGSSPAWPSLAGLQQATSAGTASPSHPEADRPHYRASLLISTHVLGPPTHAPAPLRRQPNHPIGIIKSAIYDYFEREHPGVFHTYDDLYPVVSAHAVRLGACVVLSCFLLLIQR